MASLTRAFVSRFADALTEGDIFSVYRDGEFPVRVTTPPVHIKNLVGDRSHVVVQVERVDGPGTTGQMILNPCTVVYVRRTQES
jgi:hypothetical protein